jgi:thiol-disulfide isomerase/thioredoxin
MLALSTGVFAACAADDKKDPPKDAPKVEKADGQADKLKELKKKFGAEFDDLQTKFQKAETPAEKSGIRAEAKELAALTIGKVLKIAEEDPKSETALEAAQFTFSRLLPLGAAGADADKLIAIVVEHHLNSPVAKGMILMAGRLGKSGEKLLQAAAKKATDKDVKGLALYMLGTAYAEQADDADDEKAATELTAKAIDHLERAAKTAPDAKLGPDTLGKAAGEEIAALKKLGVGKPAPDVEGVELRDEKKVKLSSYKGKVVLLDVWATWCGPCRKMIPHEREMVKKLEGKPFVLVSVSADDKKETLTKFLEKEPMPWTHWWAGEESDVLKTLRVKAFPTLYLIDAKGVIRKKWIGSPKPEVLDKAIEDLVKEAPAKG